MDQTTKPHATARQHQFATRQAWTDLLTFSLFPHDELARLDALDVVLGFDRDSFALETVRGVFLQLSIKGREDLIAD